MLVNKRRITIYKREKYMMYYFEKNSKARHINRVFQDIHLERNFISTKDLLRLT